VVAAGGGWRPGVVAIDGRRGAATVGVAAIGGGVDVSVVGATSGVFAVAGSSWRAVAAALTSGHREADSIARTTTSPTQPN
jgi:hypothetical protein